MDEQNDIFEKLLEINETNYQQLFREFLTKAQNLNNLIYKPNFITHCTTEPGLDENYKGTLLHHVVWSNDIAIRNLPYVVAILYMRGCSWEIKDSRGISAIRCLYRHRTFCYYNIMELYDGAIETLRKSCNITLPAEILIDIARQGNWLTSGPLARCSKSLLLQFTDPTILKEIVDSIKPTNGYLLKWLVLSLPSKYLRSTDANNAVNPLESYSHVLDPEGLRVSNIFVSGGSVCQSIYRLEWDCDIDIYANYNIKSRLRISRNNKIFDVIPATGAIERVIENFDLSIVQQGFLDDVFYLTPLSLYTQVYKEIIAMPNEMNIQYRYHSGYPNHQSYIRTVNIWKYITYHEIYHDPAKFHECDRCVCWNMPPVISWNKRVKKYRDRFPNFTIAYCMSPNIQKKLYEIGQ